jgi:hypothetical protein
MNKEIPMQRHFWALAVLVFLFGCKKDSTTEVVSPPDLANDYFPISRSYVWTYSTNALSDSGRTYRTIEIKVDTFTFSRGNFWAMLGRYSGTTQWGAIFAIKDSGGTVYGIGDHPPETPYPLFKHSYTSGEGTRETISVGGVTYDAVRVSITPMNGRVLSLWFAKGVGLIKEESNQGLSLWTDDNSSKNVLIQSTLISLQK